MVNEWSVMVHTILASSPARNWTIWTHGIPCVQHPTTSSQPENSGCSSPIWSVLLTHPYIYIFFLYFFFGRFHNHGGTPLFLRWMVTISWNIHRTKWMTGGTVLSQLSADGPQHCIAKNSPVVLQSTCNHFLVW